VASNENNNEDAINLAANVAVGRIPDVVVPPDDQPLRFSFKYLDTTSAKFSVTSAEPDYHAALLCCIKHFCGWTVDRFCDQNNQENRHIIVFSETSEISGFSSAVPEEQLQYSESWQFAVDVKTLWRVHGFIIEDTFYIVWLDPQHALYPYIFPEN